jgi:MoxR-like ATPase
MPLPYYTGIPENYRDISSPASLPLSRLSEYNKPSGYRPDPGLRDAVNVALILGQPLLLTGEPGTGKTQLAYSISGELGYGEPWIFETKSTSIARDLFYVYDTLSRFHAAQLKEGSSNSLDYITFNALGNAILRANQKVDVRKWLAQRIEEGYAETWLTEQYKHPGAAQRSVVLIDEIDKAPRDFPNDLLNEVENMYFKVPELGLTEPLSAKRMRPILVVTSNSEKHLPDAFLRRCIYYNIPFPNEERLRDIIESRIGKFDGATDILLADALDFFDKLRALDGLRRRPATAELLSWLTYLTEMEVKPNESLRKYPEIVLSSLSTLVKSQEDQLVAEPFLRKWLGIQSK